MSLSVRKFTDNSGKIEIRQTVGRRNPVIANQGNNLRAVVNKIVGMCDLLE
jgi:hypothetical protein